MSTLSIIMLIVLAYIVQVLLMLAYPYYRYRQSCKKDRTIGEFVRYTHLTIGNGYILLVIFPIIGFVTFIITSTIGYTATGLQLLYNKYIKDIKI